MGETLTLNYLKLRIIFCKFNWQKVYSAIIFIYSIFCQINVGCGASSTHKYPVRLEYSVNGGKTWQLIVPNCADYALARCDDQTWPTSIYYSGTSKYWRRIIIPLDGLHACG